MAGSDSRREGNRKSARADQISMAARLGLVAWEIVWTILHEHVLRGTGPWRLL